MNYYIEPFDFTNNVVALREYFEFDLTTLSIGPGIADFRGFIVKADSDLFRFFAVHGSNVEDTFIDQYRHGIFVDNERTLPPNVPTKVGFKINRTIPSCEQSIIDFNALKKILNLGDITVKPIIDNIKIESNEQHFKVKLGKDITVFNCKELFATLKAILIRHDND